MYAKVWWMAIVIAILVFYFVPQVLLGLSSRRAEFELAARFDEIDARVPLVVEKLRARGRTVLANRIAGAHKRAMFLDEFDLGVAKTYQKAAHRSPGLARRIESAYGKPKLSGSTYESSIDRGLYLNGAQ